MVRLLAGAIFRREFFWREILLCVFYFGWVRPFFVCGGCLRVAEAQKKQEWGSLVSGHGDFGGPPGGKECLGGMVRLFCKFFFLREGLCGVSIGFFSTGSRMDWK